MKNNNPEVSPATLAICALALIVGHCLGQTSKAPESPIAHFQNCRQVGGSGNSPKPFDSSIQFKCGDQIVEVHGVWHYIIEYGYVYRDELGQPDMKPQPATEWDRDFWKWCRMDERQIKAYDWAYESGGPESIRRAKMKPSMKPWYPNPNDFPSCIKAEAVHEPK